MKEYLKDCSDLNPTAQKFFLFNCSFTATYIMGSQAENDPFDIIDKKKVKIKEFLVYKESEGGQDNYVIKRFDKTKEQNLEALKYIQSLIRSDPDLKSDGIKGYLKSQRFFMKLYLKEVNKNESI